MEAKKFEQSNASEFQAHTRLLRSVAWQGIVSSLVLILAVVLLLAAFYMSYLAGGNGGISVGILGLSAAAAALVSAGFAIAGLRDRTKRHGACFIGGIGALLLIAALIWICIAL